ncbi:hypothetical protein THAOC_15884 [Thalassiosira oceanica]|uniref:SAP domain-containing protein n=1 Tax=Thalassiosira oceanica TaxID=159749 RepID=K0SYX4_THAOC|nr:hypothetical protein THAOC_15884 [Thalassiosira oceanica]|eukprot:EJK63452.1 hypothetical protein THAOC_15884 [Thalassiosira oceanica]
MGRRIPTAIDVHAITSSVGSVRVGAHHTDVAVYAAAAGAAGASLIHMDRGLQVSGRKADLVQRLEEYDALNQVGARGLGHDVAPVGTQWKEQKWGDSFAKDDKSKIHSMTPAEVTLPPSIECERVAQEMKEFLREQSLYPRGKVTSRGKPFWDTHPGNALLKFDIAEGKLGKYETCRTSADQSGVSRFQRQDLVWMRGPLPAGEMYDGTSTEVEQKKPHKDRDRNALYFKLAAQRKPLETQGIRVSIMSLDSEVVAFYGTANLVNDFSRKVGESHLFNMVALAKIVEESIRGVSATVAEYVIPINTNALETCALLDEMAKPVKLPAAAESVLSAFRS